ncbi:MAG: chloride channel protein, partial [Clostridia bacterium]|nr:chloride channel protein [Clostridia bacterium]
IDVTYIREKNDWLIFLLPAAAVLITFIYSFSKEKLTTDTVFSGIREKREISLLLAPFIFIASIISHIVGASVGREGAALQIGGGIGSSIGHMLKVGESERGRLLVLGMSGAFAAIFMTPVTAAIFTIEVLTVGHMRYYRIFYCMISSLTAFAISLAMGNVRTEFPLVHSMDFDMEIILKCALLALISGLVAHLFCHVIHVTEKYSDKLFKNRYIRAAVLGAVILVLTLLLGTRMYNGAGMDVIELFLSGDDKAILGLMTGITLFAFLIKMIITALSISAGFKGGEIVPSFYIGAALGVLFGMVMGLDLSFAASVGMIVLFTGITNCPVATLVLATELFGSENIIYYALAVGIGFIASGKKGIYMEQKLAY